MIFSSYSPLWMKAIALAGMVSFFGYFPMFWHLHFDFTASLLSLTASALVSIPVSLRIRQIQSMSDDRDKNETWINPAIRRATLRREHFKLWLGTVMMCHFSVLLVMSAMVFFEPLEIRTRSVSSTEICKRRCNLCQLHAEVRLFDGMPSTVCGDGVVPPLTSDHTAVLHGRFSRYVAYISHVERGPSEGKHLLELLEGLSKEIRGQSSSQK